MDIRIRKGTKNAYRLLNGEEIKDALSDADKDAPTNLFLVPPRHITNSDLTDAPPLIFHNVISIVKWLGSHSDIFYHVIVFH